MVNSGGEVEDWGEGSGDEEEREEGDDDLIEVQPSGSRDSVNPILRLGFKCGGNGLPVAQRTVPHLRACACLLF